MEATKFTEAPDEIEFSVFRQDMSMKPEIKKAFLKTVKVSEEDLIKGYIQLDDGTEWVMYANESLKRAILEELWPVKAICSFQVHSWGNAVVCRLYKEMKGAI